MDNDHSHFFYEYAYFNIHQKKCTTPDFDNLPEKAHSRYFSEDAYKAANEPKELMIIPGAVHTDLYDNTDIIPFDKLESFFRENLK